VFRASSHSRARLLTVGGTLGSSLTKLDWMSRMSRCISERTNVPFKLDANWRVLQNRVPGELDGVTYVKNPERFLEIEFPPLHLLLVVLRVEQARPPPPVCVFQDIPLDLAYSSEKGYRRERGSFERTHSLI